MQRFALLLVLVLFCGSGWSVAAGAGRPTATRIEEATRLFKDGAYEEALKIYNDLYAGTRRHRAQFLYAIARCQEELDRPEEALGSYEKLLEMKLPPDVRGKAENSVRHLRDRLSTGRLVLHVSPFGAEVVLDGKRVEGT